MWTILLWWVPKTEVRALPAVCALLLSAYGFTSPDVVSAAFVGFVVALMGGTIWTIIEGTGAFQDPK